MTVEECFCGAPVECGDDRDAAVAAWHGHFSEHHAEFGLTVTQVRNRVERVAMLDPPGERVDEVGRLDIVDLDPAHVDDVLEFFDRKAFADKVVGAEHGEDARLDARSSGAVDDVVDAGLRLRPTGADGVPDTLVLPHERIGDARGVDGIRVAATRDRFDAPHRRARRPPRRHGWSGPRRTSSGGR